MLSVSVIIPAFNSAATIVEALESIAMQTCQPGEVIVVDDASTDDTVKVARAWLAGRSSGAKGWAVIPLSKNSGPAGARNRGVAQAGGEWIAYLDADDVWLPERLERQLDCQNQCPDAVMLCGGRREFGAQVVSGQWSAANGKSSKAGEHRTLNVRRATSNVEGIASRIWNAEHSCPAPARVDFREVTLEELARHNPIVTSTVLVKRSALEAVGGFDEQFRGPEDYDLWIRLAAHGRIIELGEPLACYRHRPGSLSLDERRFLPQVLRVLEKAFGPGGALHQKPEWHHAALATQYQQASWMAFSRGSRARATGYLAVAWAHNVRGPRRIVKPWLALLYRYLAGRPANG